MSLGTIAVGMKKKLWGNNKTEGGQGGSAAIGTRGRNPGQQRRDRNAPRWPLAWLNVGDIALRPSNRTGLIGDDVVLRTQPTFAAATPHIAVHEAGTCGSGAAVNRVFDAVIATRNQIPDNSGENEKRLVSPYAGWTFCLPGENQT